MRVLALASLGCFLVMGAVVGFRLLALAKRTRGAPEFLAGLGLVCLSVLGHPFSALGRLPAFVGTATGDVLFGIGLATTAAGIGLVYAFTWKVFRARDAWAVGIVALATLMAAVECAGLLSATSVSGSMEEVLPRARPWTIAICLTLAAGFGWTAVEGLLYHDKLRRRLAVGLADPVVADRVRLWGLSGMTAGALLIHVAWLAWRGGMVLHDPSALIVTSVAGIATAALWYLAFLPPQAYLRWVQNGSAPKSA
jgi:hypothetical protein